ncbi:MAG: S-layer homology domain-containing protein [Clostridia bacterium]|nr:S-layer homology domain-containing protein [Clostridia bacterium]
MNRKQKNTFALSVALLVMLIGISVHGADSILNQTVSITDDIVTISGQHFSETESQVTVSVTLDGESEPFYWYGKTSANDGTFTFTYQMDKIADKNGRYNVSLGGAGIETPALCYYDFFVPANEADILTAINTATTKSEVESAITTYGPDFGVGTFVDSVYTPDAIFSSLIQSQDSVYECLLNRNFVSTADVKDAFNKACLIARLNETTLVDAQIMIFEVAPILEFDVERGSFFAQTRKAEMKERVYKEFTGKNLSLWYTQQLKENFDKISALNLINDIDTSNRSTLIEKIQMCNDKSYCDISLSEYNSDTFNDEDRLDIIAAFLAEKDNALFDSFTAAENAFTKAVNDIKISKNQDTEEDDNNTSTYPDNSGGGGGGGSHPIDKIVVDTELIPDAPKDEVKIQFTDLSDTHWAYSYINLLVNKKILSGMGNGLFEPDRNIKREEFVKVLVEAFNIKEAENKTSFEDVSEDAWYAESVKAAYEKGIINGVDENSFGVGAYITREDLCVMIYRGVKALSLSIESNQEEKTFSDEDEISPYAKEAVKYLSSGGIIAGMGNDKFEPKSPATRAMTAKIIASVMERGGLQ